MPPSLVSLWFPDGAASFENPATIETYWNNLKSTTVPWNLATNMPLWHSMLQCFLQTRIFLANNHCHVFTGHKHLLFGHLDSWQGWAAKNPIPALDRKALRGRVLHYCCRAELIQPHLSFRLVRISVRPCSRELSGWVQVHIISKASSRSWKKRKGPHLVTSLAQSLPMASRSLLLKAS